MLNISVSVGKLFAKNIDIGSISKSGIGTSLILINKKVSKSLVWLLKLNKQFCSQTRTATNHIRNANNVLQSCARD